MRRHRGRRGVRLIEPGRDGQTWWCRPFGEPADLPIPLEQVPAGAEPGSTWVAEVSIYEDGSVVVLRIVAPLAEHADEEPDPEGTDRPATPGPPRPLPRPAGSARAGRLARGTIVSAHIEFSGTPGHRDGNLLGKFRPCVVIADHGQSLDVQPLFTSRGGAARGGHPILDWHAAGLSRQTYLGPQTVRITPDDLGSAIGALTARDLPSVNPARR
jgi:hypothetical protein